MKFKTLLCFVCLAMMTVTIGNAQDYTSYDYVETFAATPLKGM